ncbi:hypothetical protein SODG_002392 [Sodalis praecaptivus]
MYVDLQGRSRPALAPRAMSLLALFACGVAPGARAGEILPPNAASVWRKRFRPRPHATSARYRR